MHAYNSISLHFNCRTFHTMPAQWRRRLPTLTQLYCGRHVASFLKVWKGSQSDPNYLDKQNNSLLIFLPFTSIFLHASRKGGGFIFIHFSVCKFNENACSVKRGGPCSPWCYVPFRLLKDFHLHAPVSCALVHTYT